MYVHGYGVAGDGNGDGAKLAIGAVEMTLSSTINKSGVLLAAILYPFKISSGETLQK